MKYTMLVAFVTLTACASQNYELEDRLEAERDFHNHQRYIEEIYTTYEPEYIDDCLYYESLVCEFE